MKNKKRIGILTFHKSINNGAVMQAYSLSLEIKKRFPHCDVEIIDYHMKKIESGYRYTVAKYIKADSVIISMKKFFTLLRFPSRIKKINLRTDVFESCWNKLPLSKFSVVSDSTEEIFEYINENIDLLVVGSDAVWNYVIRGFPNAYFPDDKVKAIKMSYAASCCGMNYLKINDTTREKIGEILNGFSFLGVRDEATENFVSWSGCNLPTVHTCDPTVFLDVNKLPIDEIALKEKLRKRGFDFNRTTIGVMGSDRMVKMIRKMYGRKYQIAALYNPTAGVDVNLYDLEPYEWAYVFRYFKLTFTTYFHGTLLSLRNKVPVVCIALQTEFAKVHIHKTLDVLKRIGHEDWYFSTDYRNENIKEIKEKADEFLSSDYGEEIELRMNKEAETANPFFEKLKDSIEK